MPCLAVHLAIASEYLKLHPEENKEEFIHGSFAPDISSDKAKSHYGTGKVCSNFKEVLENKVDLGSFLASNTLDSSFNRGYFLHLLADHYYYRVYVLEHFSFDKFDIKTVKIDLYNDFNIITPIIMKKYKLDIPDFLDEKYKEILSVNKMGKTVYMSANDFIPLIEKLSKTDLNAEKSKFNNKL